MMMMIGVIDVVKSAVGQTPALLGNKLVCTYQKGNGYLYVVTQCSYVSRRKLTTTF